MTEGEDDHCDPRLKPIVVRILLMTGEKVRVGEVDHRPLICKQHQFQFNTNYNHKEEILLTHTFNSEEAT